MITDGLLSSSGSRLSELAPATCFISDIVLISPPLVPLVWCHLMLFLYKVEDDQANCKNC